MNWSCDELWASKQWLATVYATFVYKDPDSIRSLTEMFCKLLNIVFYCTSVDNVCLFLLLHLHTCHIDDSSMQNHFVYLQYQFNINWYYLTYQLLPCCINLFLSEMIKLFLRYFIFWVKEKYLLVKIWASSFALLSAFLPMGRLCFYITPQYLSSGLLVHTLGCCSYMDAIW